MIDDSSDNSVVQAASINDPFVPPRPAKLPKSATEAEKQERAAKMRERKRCQDAVNNAKRARGAGRSKEKIGAVAASSIISNGRRAKSGGHGGHRDGADRNPEDVVASTIRRGLPECDHWPWNGKGTKVCDNGDEHKGVFKCGRLFDGSFKTLYHGTMYEPQIVIALLSVQISFVYRFVFRFTGNMREGRWDGHGTQKFPNGC